MAKKKAILGIDFGYDRVKLALVKDGHIRKAISIPMPENLMRDGRVVSPDTMAALLREAIQANHIHATQAALVLSDEPLYLRSLFMPEMPEEQLILNLPYEFNDYITGELKDYTFDYAVIHLPKEKTEEDSDGAAPVPDTNPGQKKKEKKSGLFRRKTAENPNVEPDLPPPTPDWNGGESEHPEDAEAQMEFPDGMELLAVAAPEAMLEEAREIMRKAGLHLVRAAPVECAFVAMIRAAEFGRTPKPLEYCFLDLGYRTIRMYMFRGVRHMATRALDSGLSVLDEVIAEAFHVDVHVAHTYLLNNYQDCQHQEFCQRAYNNIAVELTRALNFFRFSNPDSHLSGVWVFGGGAVIEPLRQTITQTLDLKVHRIIGMIPGSKDIPESYTFAPAVGITEAFPGADQSFIQRRRNLPFKVSINLAQKPKKRVSIALGALIAAGIVLAAALFGKFAVYDLWREMVDAREAVETAQNQLDAGYERIESFGQINDIYAHYTTSDMTEEELKRADRLEIMNLLRRVILPRTPLDAWNISKNQLTMTISGSTLESINETAKAIRAEDMVSYCTVNTAATGSGSVSASIVIYFKDNTKMDLDSIAAEELSNEDLREMFGETSGEDADSEESEKDETSEDKTSGENEKSENEPSASGEDGEAKQNQTGEGERNGISGT